MSATKSTERPSYIPETRTSTLIVRPSASIVIAVVPFAIGVTYPEASTVATFGCSLRYAASRVRSLSAVATRICCRAIPLLSTISRGTASRPSQAWAIRAVGIATAMIKTKKVQASREMFPSLAVDRRRSRAIQVAHIKGGKK